MSDANTYGSGQPRPNDASYEGNRETENASPAQAFPWERVIFTIIYAFIAWIAFWVALLVAAAAFVVKVARLKVEADVAGYARSCAAYLRDVLAYVAGLSDEKPFPFGPFQKGDLK